MSTADTKAKLANAAPCRPALHRHRQRASRTGAQTDAERISMRTEHPSILASA